MKTPLACLNLIHYKVRTAVAVAGVSFAVALMFMQLGFREAVKISATLIYDVLNFDICIRSSDYLHLGDARSFPKSRLFRVEGVAGVKRVCPFQAGLALWRHPRPEIGEKRGILVLGLRPADDVLLDPAMRETARRFLTTPDKVLIDTTTRPEFGPRAGRQFGSQDVGVVSEIGNQAIRIAECFTRGAGLTASGAVLVEERGFSRIVPGSSPSQVTFGLVTIDEGQNANAVAQRLRAALPSDVEVLTRAETLQGEVNRWLWDTNYGLIFTAGVVVAVIVGIAIVYQVLTSEVTSLLPEYATLRAMGYRNGYLAGVVLQQASILGAVGFVPGLIVSLLMYAVTEWLAGIPIRMTNANFWLVFALSLSMCVFSGLLAMRKTFEADPADLY